MNQEPNIATKEQAMAPACTANFDTDNGFKLMQRVGNMLASSSLVPDDYKGNMPNCVIALDMANRLGANPLMVMQNLYIVYGRPGWSAQFMIATFNQNPDFSAIRYEFKGEEGQDSWACRACATEKSTGEILKGAWVSIGLAKREGWFSKKTKKGEPMTSKWQTMPEQMLMYRAASWFIRAYAPEIAMGLQTTEEIKDTYDMAQGEDGSYAQPIDKTEDLNAKLLHPEPEQAPTPDNSTPTPEQPTKGLTNKDKDALRGKALEAWTAVGGTKEEAEKELNVYMPKWAPKDCERIIDMAKDRASVQANTSAA